MKVFKSQEDRVKTGKLSMQLRDEYAERLDVQFYEPRCFLFVFDTMRCRRRSGEVTRVLDGNDIFRGVLAWDDLNKTIDEKLSA